MNSIKPKGIIFYDYQPFSKGKYKHDTSKIAIKKLCFIKNLKLTSPREYSCWDTSNSPVALNRLFKLCKSFKTNFKIPHKLFTPLKKAPLNRISLYLPHYSNFLFLKKHGVKYPLKHLTLQYPNQTSKLAAVFKILRGHPDLTQFKLRFPEGSYAVKEQELTSFSKGVNKLKKLQTLNIDTHYFTSKTNIIRSFFKSMAMWNLTFLHITLELGQLEFENIAIGISLLAGVKSLRGLEMEWNFPHIGNREEQSFKELVKAFQIFIKNQWKLNYLLFHYRTHPDIAIPTEIFKGIEKMKFLETLSLSPSCGNWSEKDVDAFISSLGGHSKLKKLELILYEFPKNNVEQFYKKLEAGLQGVKKINQLKITGPKIPGLTLEKAVGLKDVFENLRKLEFCVQLQQNSTTDATSFAKLLSSCTQLNDLMLGINQTIVLNETALNHILTAIGGLEKLVSVELFLGRVKREGNKHIFSSFFENLEKIWSFRVKFIELFLSEEDIISLGNNLIQKKQLRSVIVAGAFPSISKDVKDWFVSTLRNQGIKTPPLM